MWFTWTVNTQIIHYQFHIRCELMGACCGYLCEEPLLFPVFPSVKTFFFPWTVLYTCVFIHNYPSCLTYLFAIIGRMGRCEWQWFGLLKSTVWFVIDLKSFHTKAMRFQRALENAAFPTLPHLPGIESKTQRQAFWSRGADQRSRPWCEKTMQQHLVWKSLYARFIHTGCVCSQ